MPHFVAFLRAINVGGHTVRMDNLRQLFQSQGLADVETFIASGNVVFEAAATNATVLEKNIENALREALGYDVATFIRTDAELSDIVSFKPFRQSDLDAAAALNIGFLADTLDQGAQQRLMALRTSIDDFQVQGREIYWLCRKKQSESTISNAVLEKSLGRQLTLRGANTIRRMDAKYRFSSSPLGRAGTREKKQVEG
ncbi:MAG TPA: DUF1697 domain-containing protein [Dehalococcoidia bacterium]|nr:DUF1697 domain-containing protein [Dehalococcoidia bacterium]